MRTTLISVVNSEKKVRIVKTIFEYPKRQWSCPAVEDITKLPHATVFRALSGLRELGILKSIKINRKAIVYELTDSPLVKELKRLTDIEKICAKKIACSFIKRIKSGIKSALLYGSVVKGNIKPKSDIDILIIIKQHNKDKEEKIMDIAAKISAKVNKTISVVIIDKNELHKERNNPFIHSVREHHEVLYGKSPF